ncbi:MAG: cob(I)yrinic acid a,c-diamide adenosyltransferase [Deltaproteobacteria bacterium]|nr:cob(I)yrinic acid a,c-diamide adenosyltransferase [Deltaproteobacteria bacterium]
MTPKIYTRTGDDGTTGLYGGERVSKDHLRIDACGTIDELNCALSVAIAAPAPNEVATTLGAVQSLLFELGAELAAPHKKPKHSNMIAGHDVAWLETEIDRLEATLTPLSSFIIPGGTSAAAILHHSRAICRRAERTLVRLARADPGTSMISISFINRLADLLFVLARVANRAAGVADVAWKPRHEP